MKNISRYLTPLAMAALLLAPTNLYSESALGHALGGPEVNKENLTDKEKYTSETYVHEGLTQRMIEKACGKDETLKKACAGADVDPEFMGISGTMFKALSKAYTMVVGAGGLGELEASEPAADGGNAQGGGQATGDAQAGGDKTGSKEDKADNTDYCKYIAVGTEAISMVQQTASQQSLNATPLENPNNVGNAQKEALYRASRSHKERSNNAKIQTYGWGTSTVCYGAMMLRPGISTSSWKNWLKLGSSALMTAFFNSQVKGHQKYADQVKQIADTLPEPGDCNPVTERNCYCAQSETQYDPNYCQKEIHKKIVADNSYKISCIDDKAQADKDCSCRDTDSCLDKTFVNYLKGLGFNETMNKGVVTPLSKFAKGELVGGKLDTSDIAQAAMAKKTLEQLKDKMPNDSVSLNKDQLAEAKAIQSLGIPAALARKMASMPYTAEAKKLGDKLAKAGIGGGTYNPSAGTGNRYNNGSVLTFQGGNGNRKSGRSTSSNIDYKKFLPKKGKSTSNGQVLNFAKEAEARAQIHHKGDNRNIFQIISRRYQVTGWNKLGYE